MLIYPAIDLLGGRCVRLRQGDYSRETVFSDDPAAVGRRWVELGADRLHLVDLARQVADAPLAAVVYTDITKDGMMGGPNFDALAEMRSAVALPVIASGGVCTPDHVRRLAAAGTHGCIIGRALYEGSLDLSE